MDVCSSVAVYVCSSVAVERDHLFFICFSKAGARADSDSDSADSVQCSVTCRQVGFRVMTACFTPPLYHSPA